MIEPNAGLEQDPSVKKRKETGFAGDVLKLVSGATIAQALGILAAPVLSRLFAPEAFGVAAVFGSVVAVAGVFATMQYHRAILLPAKDEEAANLVVVSLIFTVFISLLVAIIIWVFRSLLLQFLNAPGLSQYLWLTAPAVFVAGVMTIFNFWNSRYKHFGRLSVARMVNSSTATVTSVIAGVAGFVGGGTLIGAKLGGQVVAASILGGQMWRDDRNLFRTAIQKKGMALEIKRYRKFPLFTTWATLLNTASWQLPAFLFSSFFSTEVVGYYAFGFRVLQLPMSMIGRAIGQVFFQRAAEARITNTIGALVESTFRRLVMFGLFPMLLLMFIGGDLFSIVFGDEWREAGIYVQILAPWGFVWFISSPMSTLSSVFEKQEFGLTINAIIFISRLLALGIGGMIGNARLALALFSISGFFVYGYLNLWLMNLAGIRPNRVFRILLPYILLFMPVGVSLVILQLINASTYLTLCISLLFSVAYFIYIIRSSPLLRHFIKRFWHQAGVFLLILFSVPRVW